MKNNSGLTQDCSHRNGEKHTYSRNTPVAEWDRSGERLRLAEERKELRMNLSFSGLGSDAIHAVFIFPVR